MKKEDKTERTKERILKAAMVEFGKYGYAGASLNNICKTGISKGLLYHNFENKDAVYLACVEHCFCQLTQYLAQQNIGADIRRYMNCRLQFFRENESEARLFFEAVLQPPARLGRQINELRKDFDALNRELYLKTLASVSLRQGVTQEDALNYFTLMQNMFNGYFSSPVYRGMPMSEVMTAHEAGLEKLLDFMLYGIAQRRAEK